MLPRSRRGAPRSVRLAALGAVSMWRTVSADQLAVIVGYRPIASARSTDMAVLWSSGLVQRGEMHTGAPGRAPVLWRPDPGGNFERLADRLTGAEWLALTAGVPWGSAGGTHDRHDLLATELSLRAAELTSVAVALGERLGGVERLTGAPSPASATADAVWLRSDGLRMAIELTSSVTPGLRAKAARWADALAAEAGSETAVVFAEAGHRTDADPPPGAGPVARALRAAVSEAAWGSLDAAGAGVAERMMVAYFSEWFPGLGLVSPSFLTLRAYRPTGGPESTGSSFAARHAFEPVAMLDPFDLAGPAAGAAGEAVASVERARGLFGVPHWQRGGHGVRPAPVG